MKKITAVFVAIIMTMMLAVPAFAVEDETVVSSLCLGDVNDDGIITPADARLALRFAVSLDEPTADELVWANYDGDDTVEVSDARDILRVSVNLDAPKAHSEETVEKVIDAKWLETGCKGEACADCGRFVGEVEAIEANLTAVVDAANDWAKDAGFDSIIAAAADLENAQIDIIANVDGIWELEDDLADVSFDGFMTAIGDAVEAYVGDSTVKIVDQTVYADNKFQNTAIKNVLFEVGAGFFYKLANLDDSLVFGFYAVAVDDEAFTVTVKVAGTDENIEKVKSFADTVAQHISATVVDGNLVIDVKAPDALVNKITEMKPVDTVESLNAMPIRGGLNIVSSMDVEDAFGSQQSAINRLCAVLNSLDGFVNKVLGKVTEATVATMDGTTVDLLSGEDFEPEEDDDESALSLFIEAAKDVMSDDLLSLTVGEFANGDYYTLRIDFTVDMSNIGDMVNSFITETVYVNIHVFDDVTLG